MPPSVTRRAVAAASSLVGKKGLKAAGFRRQSNHFHRNHAGLIHAVHFQASQWGTAGEGSFTVNLCVTSPGLYETWTSKPLPANPATALFPISVRIGHLMPSRGDHWWAVNEETDLVDLSERVAAAILQYGLPLFDAFPSAESILTRLRNREALPGVTESQVALVHATLAAEAGCISEAQACIDQSFENAGDSPFRETVRRIGVRLGVPPGRV